MRMSTFSIVACDQAADELGVAVQSKFLAVGSAVPWATGGVGAVATQAWANTSYGPRALGLLEFGHDPQTIIQLLTESDDQRAQRQIGIVDANGRSASYTGDQCMEWAGGIAGPSFAVQGNILAGPAVVESMASAFMQTAGCLADRLVACLRAGQAQGGDRRGRQSAALYVAKPAGGYGGFNDRYIDLRVDDHLEPIEELARILELHKLYSFKAAPEDVMTIDARLGLEICQLLHKAGKLDTTTSFNDTAWDALVKFMHAENLEDRVRPDRTIDKQTLEYLRAFVRR